MSTGGTAIGRDLLWLMQRSKIKTKGIREKDCADGRKTQDKNATQTHLFLICGKQERKESCRIGRHAVKQGL